jgi:hypothetical protein
MRGEVLLVQFPSGSKSMWSEVADSAKTAFDGAESVGE